MSGFGLGEQGSVLQGDGTHSEQGCTEASGPGLTARAGAGPGALRSRFFRKQGVLSVEDGLSFTVIKAQQETCLNDRK